MGEISLPWEGEASISWGYSTHLEKKLNSLLSSVLWSCPFFHINAFQSLLLACFPCANERPKCNCCWTCLMLLWCWVARFSIVLSIWVHISSRLALYLWDASLRLAMIAACSSLETWVHVPFCATELRHLCLEVTAKSSAGILEWHADTVHSFSSFGNKNIEYVISRSWFQFMGRTI